MSHSLPINDSLLLAALEHSSELIGIFAHDGTILYFNAVAEEILGYEPASLCGHVVFEQIHPDDLAPVREAFSSVLSARRVELQAHRYRSASDEWKYLEAAVTLLPQGDTDASAQPILLLNYHVVNEGIANDGVANDHAQVQQTPAQSEQVTQAEQATQAEQTAQAEQNFRSIFDAVPVGVSIHDSGIVLDANQRAADMLGYDLGDIIGQPVEKAFAPESRALVRDQIARGAPEAFEATLLRKNGARVFAELIGRPYLHEGRTVCLTIIRDVTERREATELLQASERRYRSLVQNGLDLIGLLNQEGIHTYLSPSVTRLLGYELEELLGQPILHHIHPDDAEKAAAALATAFHGHEARLQVFRFRHANGEWRWLETVATNLLSDPAVEAIVINSRDITQRKLAEEILEKKNREITAIWESMTDAFFALDLQWRFTHVNEQAGRILQRDSKELVGCNMWDEFPEAKETPFFIQYSRAVATQQAVIFEEFYAPLGIWFEVHAYPSPIGLSVYFRDITQRKQVEEELRSSEARFQSIVANVPGMVYQCVLEPEGSLRFPFVSEGCCELFEREPEEFQRNPGDILNGIEDRARFDQSVFESAKRLQPWCMEGRIKLPSGKTKWYQGAARPQRLESGGTLWEGLIMDITDRREAEEERDRFFTLSLDMLCIAGNDGYFKRLNPAFETTLGYNHDELMARPFIDFVHPDDRAAAIAAAERLSSGNPVVNFENRCLCKDGNYKCLAWTAVPFGNAIYAVARDVTAFREAEQALRISEERFRIVSRATNDVIWDWDMVTDDLWWNESYQAVFGYRPDEIGSTITVWADRVHPGDKDRVVKDLHAEIEAGHHAWSSEYRFRRADGSYVDVFDRGYVIRDAQGKPQRMIGSMLDISGRKQTEETLRQAKEELEIKVAARTVDLQAAYENLHNELKERRRIEASLGQSEERFRLLVEGVKDYGIFMLDRHGYVESWNAGAERVIGYKADEIIDHHMSRFYTPEDIEAGQPERELLLATQNLNHEEEGWRVRKDGSRFWASVAVTALHDETGQLRGCAKIIRDITERKNTEEALRRAKEEAERANRAKSEFLSRMSHELRTPLNAILGFGQVLELQHMTPLQQESVGHILKGGQHLLGLINEVLDISRVESGHLTLSLEPVPLQEVINESLNMVRPLADQNHILLRQQALPQVGLHVLADRQRLKQVLINLLSNAVKYNRAQGSVTLLCTISPDDWVRLSIRDTGKGITPQDIGKLFIPFERLSAEQTAIEGTGLGLTLSKRLVDAMQGVLTVESSREGSTFSVELPRAENPLQSVMDALSVDTQMPVSPSSGAIHRVLIIEDNVSNLRLVEALVAHRPDIKLFVAMEGALGLELAVHHQPHLILLDLHLPDIMGDEVLQRLRRSEQTRHIPVTMCSADATPTQIERLLAAGAREYLAKPLNVKQFLATLDEALQPGNSDAPGTQGDV